MVENNHNHNHNHNQNPNPSEQSVAFLDKVYDIVVNGIPKVDKSIPELAAEYTGRYGNGDKAIKEFVKVQVMKCTTTGFVTGLGGLLTLPVTIPADLASSLYVELRMLATIAYMRGYDIHEDKVKTLVYVCIVGNAAGDLLKQAGIKGINEIAAKKILPKISEELIKKINTAIGVRLLSKGGTKGIINVGRAIPLLGGIVGGVYNYAEVKLFAKKAMKFFD